MDSRLIIDFYEAYRKSPVLYLFQDDSEETNNLQDALDTAWGMPPKQALEYLKKRGSNLIVTNRWDELDAEAHQGSFTVSKVATADLLQEIYDNVEKAKAKGWTLKQFQNELLPTLERSGWAGVKPGRLTVIFETNMRMSFAKNQYRQLKLIADKYPFWEYVQVERKTKRHSHTRLNGKKFRHDDPIWQKIFPPSDFGCKCHVVPYRADEVDSFDKGSDMELNPDDFQISPLKAFEPETSKYVKGIRGELEKMMKGREVPKQTGFESYKTQSKIFYKSNPETAKAFENYCGTEYEDINNHLRFGTQIDTSVSDTISKMDEDFKIKLSEDTITYRGMTIWQNEKEGITLFNNLKGGKIKSFEEKGFLSTSVLEAKANQFLEIHSPKPDTDLQIKFIIRIKKDTEVGVGSRNNYSEQEIICKTNSKFVIKNVEQIRDNFINVYMEGF